MLRLTILDAPADEIPVGESFVVGPGGASLGRIKDNTWSLTDRNSLVSRTHCEILFEQGAYMLLDTSTNGTFMNDSAEPVGRGKKAALQDGNRVRLGEYVLGVTLERPAELDSDVGDRPSFLVTQAPVESPPQESITPEPPAINVNSDAGNELLPDFDNLQPAVGLSDSAPGNAIANGGAANLPDLNVPSTGLQSMKERVSNLLLDAESPPSEPIPEDFLADMSISADPLPGDLAEAKHDFTAPPVLSGSENAQSEDLIPSNWFTDSPKPADPGPAEEPEVPSVPVPPPAPTTQDMPDISSALADTATSNQVRDDSAEPVTPTGATSEQLPDESGLTEHLRKAVAAALGEQASSLSERELLRVVEEMAAIISLSTEPLMNALAVRTEVKDLLRLDQTMVQARNNNPLKFCQSAQEAVGHMLLNDHPGLLNGRKSMEEAFREISQHQRALFAALRPALKSTLERVSPEAVNKALGASDSGFNLPKSKGKLWETYQALYAKLMSSGRGNLEQKFMRDLAEHYERNSRSGE